MTPTTETAEYTQGQKTKERRHLDGIRTLENRIVEHFTRGEVLPLDTFSNVLRPDDENFEEQLEHLYQESEEAYASVVGHTFSGEAYDHMATTPDERLKKVKRIANIAKVAGTPLSALLGATFIAEVDHFLGNPEYIHNPSNKEAPGDPDDLSALLAPVNQHLESTHRQAFHSKVKHLIPEEIHEEVEASITISRARLHQRTLIEMVEKIRSLDGEASYRRAIAELPYKSRLYPEFHSETSVAEFSRIALATIHGEGPPTVNGWPLKEGEPEIKLIDQISNKRSNNYRDALRAAILTYSALRQNKYTPQEAITNLLDNAGTIGRLTERTLDNIPSGVGLRDADSANSLTDLLGKIDYVSIERGEQGAAISYLHVPPHPKALSSIGDNPENSTADIQRNKRQRSQHGACPIRQRIEKCPPNIAYLLSELKAFGMNTSILREDGSIRGGSLAAIISIMAAEQSGTFKQLEENPHFQEIIEQAPKQAQDYYA